MNSKDEGLSLLDGLREGLNFAEQPRQGVLAREAWQMMSGLLEAARVIPARLRAPDGSLPLTILSGFLGAGKTTLLNRLLSEPGGRRLAVLVNDFGRINIDAELIRSRTEDMISLANGCVCCTVSTELTRTLIDLAQRPDPPEAIVLEASGLADPRGIAQVALSNPALRLDGILTLADAVALSQPDLSQEVLHTLDRQFDAADLIVLTKTDEAVEAQQQAVRQWLAQRHPNKPVVRAVQGDLPAQVVLGLHSVQDPRLALPAPWDHSSAFESWTLQCSEPLDGPRLQAFLSHLPAGLLRVKGVLFLAQTPQCRHVYQRVGPRARLDAESPWGSERPASSLVIIGPKGCVDEAALQQAFADLTVPN
ncbi:CobW family GTP-binding protein [Delftia lacustris]|jgi:G3E family GTPase